MADAADNPEDKDLPTRALDDDDIALLKTYGLGPYSTKIKDAEKDLKELSKKVNDVCGVKESDTGLAAPSRWDLRGDKQVQQAEQPLQVCTAHVTIDNQQCNQQDPYIAPISIQLLSILWKACLSPKQMPLCSLLWCLTRL